MAKSKAEIQKAYRERKKLAEGERYLEKERQRRRRYYVPRSQMNETQLKEVRRRNNEDVKKNYRKKKQEAQEAREAQAAQNAHHADNEDDLSSGHDTASSLIVKMDFTQKRSNKGARKRISRELNRAKYNVKKLTAQNANLTRKYKTILRRYQRQLKSKLEKTRNSPSTPRSLTEKVMRSARLSTDQASKVRKQLLLGNVLIHEIKESSKSISTKRSGEKNILSRVIGGKILKKYSCGRLFRANTGINRNSLNKGENRKKFERSRIKKAVNRMYIDFISRDDNSRMEPGKKDFVKVDGRKEQRRILTDYMGNLYLKFLFEHPTVSISRSLFCEMRPKNFRLCSFLSRSSCLCTKHQNIALLLKALRKLNIDVPINPDTFAKEPKLKEINVKLTADANVTFSQWKRVEIEEKGKKKNVMRIVESEKQKDQFMNILEDMTADFQGHVKRIKTQFTELKALKQNLKYDEVILLMDFAENYNCKSCEEIQSAYWNQTAVTIHPQIFYYMEEESQSLKHQSIITVSDELGHNTSTVHAMMDLIIPEIKAVIPQMKKLHIYTDGPTSQYRNKQIFNTVSNFQVIYGVDCTWNYYEVGHGKSACDGLGGRVKRLADEAVCSGKVTITGPKDFYQWAAEKSPMPAVNFLWLGTETCQQKKAELDSRQVRPLKGTFTLHAVSGLGEDTVAVSDVSCYCNVCHDNGFCDKWKIVQLQIVKAPAVRPNPAAVTDIPVAAVTDTDALVVTVINTPVAAVPDTPATVVINTPENSHLPGRSVIPVIGDGRCFFRSVIASMDNKLQKAPRDQYGVVLDRQLELLEKIKADQLRMKTVHYMKNNIQQYENVDSAMLNADMPNADMPNHIHFLTINDRIQAMQDAKAMIGEFEIIAATEVLSRKIQIEDRDGKLINVYGTQFNSNPPLILQYTSMDNDAGHYDCVISTSSIQDVIRSISPLPKAMKPRTRTRRSESAKLITASPYKEALLKKQDAPTQRKKTQKAENKKLTKRKRSRSEKCSQQRKHRSTETGQDKPSAAVHDNKCIYCCESYENSRPGEMWIQCLECKEWAHEDCTEGKHQFICFLCE